MARPFDSILDISGIYLFGRKVDELSIRKSVESEGRLKRGGDNNLLKRQLDANGRSLARIYAFSFEGNLFEMTRPTIFLVHGPGMNVEEIPDSPGLELIARSPPSPTTTGMGSQIGSFARLLRVWLYDKGDYTLRLDLASGTFEQMLLGPETGDYSAFGGAARSSGARSSGARSSGARSSGARSSGVMARSSGAMGGWDYD